jgi:hypothetical protein
MAFLISTPLFVGYSGLLSFLLPVSGTLAGALLLVVLQVTVGLAATRVYSALGARIRSQLRFVDPSMLGSDWKESETEMHPEEISRLFERMNLEIRKYNHTTIDDLNDVAWFAVLVYSVVSTAIAVATGPNVWLSIGAGVVLAALCAICFRNGYGSAHIKLLDEDMDQLEYHAMARLSSLRALNGKGRDCVRWLERGKLQVLSDMGMIVDSLSAKITYWLGIPSQQQERFEIMSPQEPTPGLIAGVRSIPIIAESNWQLVMGQQGSGTLIRISNPKKLIRISSLSSIIVDPTSSSAASSSLVETLSMILRLFAA